MAPKPPSRWAKHRSRTRPMRFLILLGATAAFILVLLSLHATAALLRLANSLGRQCMSLPPGFPTEGAASRSRRIAMVSLSDEGAGGPQRRRQAFQGLRAATQGNKQAYATQMGYRYIDAGDLVDRSRPPNWSKILAVRAHLPHYDWVFWNDADTLVTNPNMSLENVLLAAIGHRDFHSSPDLVVTKDFNGVNSGVFFIRQSKWSEDFLDSWWNQTSFIQFGSTKSGDNAALKYLIDSLPEEELDSHVVTSQMQCLFNSYPWVPSWKSFYRFISSPLVTWNGVYSDGDFLVHLAGLDEKKKWVDEILQQLRTVV
ncbi:hypothetical protein ZIOFF_051340 [Zingiber officinale]|uniref:Uncharacterized protein n=1 Tax=Zingiber officinale TaxID=94328 RepID=A0A8J5FMK3_ZINOF|nr:hypothetical protein ZIOFF_051340 [Zingiber officinale]